MVKKRETKQPVEMKQQNRKQYIYLTEEKISTAKKIIVQELKASDVDPDDRNVRTTKFIRKIAKGKLSESKKKRKSSENGLLEPRSQKILKKKKKIIHL